MYPKEKSLWTWQVVTGLVILALLSLHMAIMHLSGILGLEVWNPASGDPLDWDNVAHRARQALFTVTYVLLLAAGLFHGLNGLRTILFETVASPRARRAVVAVLTTLGAGLLVLGTWAALTAGNVAGL